MLSAPAAPRVPRRLAPRTSRVLMLLGAVVLMSAADLYMTLMMIHSGGFAEENPLARAVMATGSPVLLALWKFGTVGLAVALLVRLRRHAVAEAGAWVGLVMLATVMLHWHAYAAETENLVRALHFMDASFDERWVAMTPR